MTVRRSLCGSVLGFLMFELAVLGFVGLAGAAEVPVIPWVNSGAASGVSYQGGECNETLGGHGGQYTEGFEQWACEGEVPVDSAGDLPAELILSGSYPEIGYCYGQSCTMLDGFNWWSQFAYVGSSSPDACTPDAADGYKPTREEVWIWDSSDPGNGWGNPVCGGPSGTAAVGAIPAGLSTGDVSGPVAAAWVSGVSFGAVVTVGSYSAVAVRWVLTSVQVTAGHSSDGVGGLVPVSTSEDDETGWACPGSAPLTIDGANGPDDVAALHNGGSYVGGWDNGQPSAYGAVTAHYSGSSPPWPAWGGLNGSGYDSAWYELMTLSCTTSLPGVQSAQFPADFFTGGVTGPAAASPCSLVSETGGLGAGAGSSSSGYFGDYTAGASYGWDFTFAGAADEIVVDPMDGTYTAPATQASLAPTRTVGAGGVLTVGSDATVADASSGSPVLVDLRPSSSGSWEPLAYCIYAGVVYDWGYPQTGAGPCTGGAPSAENLYVCLGTTGVTGEGSRLDACWVTTGWTWYDPVSWVVGGLKDVICVVGVIFVPCGYNAVSCPDGVNTATVSSAFENHVPFAWLTDAGGAFGTLLVAANVGASSDPCDAPTFTMPLSLLHIGGRAMSDVVLKLPDPSSCGNEPVLEGDVGDVFGFRGLVLDVSTFLVCVSVLFVGLRMLPWRVGWQPDLYGLNEVGDYIPTFYTGEGSDV